MSTVITSTNIVVTQGNRDESPGLAQNGDSLMRPTITFGAASGKSYDTNGIPVPDIAKFRLKFGITRLFISQIPGSYEWVYDKTVRTANPVAPYGTLRAYARAGGTELSGDVPVTSLDLDIWGS